MKNRSLVIIGFMCMSINMSAQEFTMMSGMMNIPTAEVAPSGTIRLGGAWVNKKMLPDQFNHKGEKYNTVNYGVGVAFFDWLEASYSQTIFKRIHDYFGEGKDFFSQDRHVNVKLRPLKEGKWWPAIAVGMDDVNLPNKIGKRDEKNLWNNYYQNVYGVMSKHFDFNQGGELSVHLGYRYYTNDPNEDCSGVLGGVAYRPNFCRDLRVMAEWDGRNVNAGVDWLGWKRLYLQAGVTNGKYPFGVISYHYTIPY